MSQNGTFDIEEANIVRLKGTGGGWVNYGLYAIRIKREGRGITVEVYPCQNERATLAAVQVFDRHAREAGAINCED